MKKLIILTIFTISSIYSMAENQAAEDTPAGRYLKQINEENSSLARALNIDGVAQIYQKCFDDQHGQNNGVVDGSSLMNCVWKDVEKDKDLKAQVLETTQKDKKGNEQNSIRYQESIQANKEQDPAIKSLQDMYEKKLTEALYGEQATKGNDKFKDKLIKSERTVDQKVFFELHKTQIGKNIVAAISSYCIESKKVTLGTASNHSVYMISDDPNERKSTREENLKSLRVQSGETIEASSKWGNCLISLQHVCHQPENLPVLDKGGNKVSDIKAYSKDNQISGCEKAFSLKSDECTELVGYTNRRACEVVQYLDEGRKNLDVVTKTIEKYDELAVQRSPANNQIPAPKFYNPATADKNIDDLTSVTSNEVMQSEYALKNKEEYERVKKCRENPTEENCAGILNSEKDQSYAMLTELKLKQEATYERLKLIEKDDTEKIQELLMEEGYSEDDAKNMASMEDIKQQIDEKYKARKDAILANMADEIEKTSITGATLDLKQGSQDLAKIQAIEDELRSKTQEFAELVHFNNIVSGYLEISTEGSDEKSKNTASIARELESNAFTKENIDAAGDLAVTNRANIDYDQYANVISQTGISLDPDSATNEDASLQKDDLNESILNYFIKLKD